MWYRTFLDKDRRSQMIDSPRKHAFTKPVHENRHLPTWAMILLFSFILATSIFTSLPLQPTPVNGQSSPEIVGTNTYLPFIQGPPPPVSDPQRAAYVTDLVDLAPFEVQRWGHGHISEVAYSPAGDRLAFATNFGVWIYRLDEPDNGRLLGYTHGALSISWSPDGSQLAFGLGDGTVQIWSVASGGK